MREPLVWPGGTRHSASGLLVQIHTDEGLIGLGEAPGPTLPTIQTIIDAELTQFLVGQDPLRVEWLVHGWKSSRGTGAGSAPTPSRDRNRASTAARLGVPVAELLGGFAATASRSSATRSSTARGECEEGEFVRGGGRSEAEAGATSADHDTLAATATVSATT